MLTCVCSPISSAVGSSPTEYHPTTSSVGKTCLTSRQVPRIGSSEHSHCSLLVSRNPASRMYFPLTTEPLAADSPSMFTSSPVVPLGPPCAFAEYVSSKELIIDRSRLV